MFSLASMDVFMNGMMAGFACGVVMIATYFVIEYKQNKQKPVK